MEGSRNAGLVPNVGCLCLGIRPDFPQTCGSVPISARPSTRCVLLTNRALATSCAQRTFQSLRARIDALQSKWYQTLASRASCGDKASERVEGSKGIATHTPHWSPATRLASCDRLLLLLPSPASQVTHHSYGVLVAALALAGWGSSAKFDLILAGKHAGRACTAFG